MKIALKYARTTKDTCMYIGPDTALGHDPTISPLIVCSDSSDADQEASRAIMAGAVFWRGNSVAHVVRKSSKAPHSSSGAETMAAKQAITVGAHTAKIVSLFEKMLNPVAPWPTPLRPWALATDSAVLLAVLIMLLEWRSVAATTTLTVARIHN